MNQNFSNERLKQEVARLKTQWLNTRDFKIEEIIGFESVAAELKEWRLNEIAKREKALSDVSIEAQIKEVRRELAMRKSVYPKWIESGKMKQENADRQILQLEAVLRTLNKVAQTEAAQKGLF